MIDVSHMNWEDYDGQTDSDIKAIGYVNLSGEDIVEEVTRSLDQMIYEVRRCNGANVPIKVYR